MKLRVALEMGAVEDSRRVVAFRNLREAVFLFFNAARGSPGPKLRASRAQAPERNIRTWYTCA